MKIGVAIPVHGREELVKHTVGRLQKQTLVPETILIIGDQQPPLNPSAPLPPYWLNHANFPLGAKWQAGVDWLRDYADNLDAFLYLGSSDWICDTWIETMAGHIKDGVDLVGKKDCYFLDIAENNRKRLIHWGGYGSGVRRNEPIGIGRMISRKILDKLNWQLFPVNKDSSLDWAQMQVILESGGLMRNVEDPELTSLSISTYKWENKHIFDNEKLHENAKNIEYVDTWLKNRNYVEGLNLFGEGV